MKDSIVFYKSFFEAIETLPEENQLELYRAIFKKYFYKEEIKLSGVSKGMFGLMIPNIDSANKRYFANVENGKKGGRPKTQIKPIENPNKTQIKPIENPNKTQIKPNNNPNDNPNDNEKNLNDNDNVNDNDNDNIYNNKPKWLNKKIKDEELSEQEERDFKNSLGL